MGRWLNLQFPIPSTKPLQPGNVPVILDPWTPPYLVGQRMGSLLYQTVAECGLLSVVLDSEEVKSNGGEKMTGH